jgi:hypothetical protein
MKRLFYGFLAVFLMILPIAGLLTQQKFTLVIGNGSYTGSGMSKLANPVNDANDVARASNRQQIPAIYNQFFNTAYFGSQPRVYGHKSPVPRPQSLFI